MFARLFGTIALVYLAAAILSYPITGVGGVVAVVISLYFVLAFFNRLDAASRRVSGGEDSFICDRGVHLARPCPSFARRVHVETIPSRIQWT
jgi:hypothetical protein